MDKLFFLLERIYLMSSIPVRCFDENGENVIFYKGYKPNQDPFKTVEMPLLEKLRQNDLPFLHYEKSLFIYGAARDASNRIIIFGPVTSRTLSNENIRIFARDHNIPEDGFYITSKTLIEISAALAALHFHITGETISEHDILHRNAVVHLNMKSIDDNVYENYIMGNAENQIEHHTYNDEQRFIKGVFNESPENVNGISTVISTKLVGKLANNPLKQMEYMTCTSITLVSRAAIEEGLDAMRAYALSDLYLQRLEMCRNESDMIKVNYDMMNSYAELVKRSKEMRSKSSYVEKCKVYIANHLNKQFTLDDLANELGINKSYLSRKFTEEMNMGIKQYTLMKRVDAAANMLKFSDTSLPKIADFFCFTSQSHFGQIFKKIKGVTPAEFRGKERLIE
ncbi:MAG: AraC family transcriptional regulator [Oscillospiraceae bacterium]|nr:AraC family transcriptional regulator [Oscillospiraceae bacterium]